MIIRYANDPLQIVFIQGKIVFLMHFNITVMLKIIFLQRIVSALIDATLQN